MAVLVTKDEEEVLLEIKEGSATIGRAEENTLCLNMGKVSQVHAKIERTDEGYILTDLDSTNGTFVNDAPIRRRTLLHGDVLRFGSYELIFRCEGEADTFVEPEIIEVEGGGEELTETEEREGAESEEETPDTEEEDERPSRTKIEDEEAEEEREDEEEEQEEEEEKEEEGEEDEGAAVEVEPDFEEEYDHELYYRQRLRKGTRQRRVRAAMWLSLFLVVSLFLHLQARYILDKVAVGWGSEYTRKPVEMEMDFVLILEEQPAPREKRTLLDLFPEEMQIERVEQRAAEDLPKLAAEVPTVHIADLSAVTELEISAFVPVREFQPDRSFTAVSDAGAVALATSERARTFSDQIDDFAMEMIHVLTQNPLHVVLIFDRSYSLEDDRDYMQKRLDHIIDLLKLNLKPSELARLRWSVVGFGDMARIYQNRTDDADKVRAAISQIANDKSGVENLLAAISYSLKVVEHGSEQAFLVVVTDEVGDDTNNDELVGSTLKSLLGKAARLYVFGAEANFSYPIVQGMGIDRATGKAMHGDVNAGPESAFSEFFEPDLFFQPIFELPSGFGMYVQSRLSAATGGRYYMLGGQQSNYTSEAMGEYAPEMCSREEYAKRREKSKVRKALATILEQWPKLRPPADFIRSPVKEEVKRCLDAGEKCDAFCGKAIEELLAEAKSVEKEKYQRKRWQANYDLILAELYRFRYLLGDYIQKLRAFGNTAPGTKDGQPLIACRIVRPPGPPQKPAKELAERWDLADRYLVKVIEKHPGTPWEAMARRCRGDMRLFQVMAIYRAARSEGEGKRPPPQPPETPPAKL